MARGVHGEKLVATRQSEKLPSTDKERLEKAIEVYDRWIENLNNVIGQSLNDIISQMTDLLNEYKFYVDMELIFDSTNDFLYRQKGQLKLDNTILEEFLPIFAFKCVEKAIGKPEIIITAQAKVFSSLYFNSSLANSAEGGGMTIKSKDQDFSMSRKLYIQSSYSPDFKPETTKKIDTQLGYVTAELKTNLDKTMFQEASATAHDIKLAVTGAKYFLLCDFLDMKPISTSTTDIDEILILRKAKRMNSNVRGQFSSFSGRQKNRSFYKDYLTNNPYSLDMFTRFAEHIIGSVSNQELIEESVLDIGYF